MKRGSPGQYTTYDTAIKRQRTRRPKRVKITGGGPQRAGYGSVARTRGAAVQGEMKYFDCDYNGVAIAAVTTTWVAGTSADPLTTINLGSAAVANPLCLVAPTVGAGLNQRVGRKICVRKIKVHGTLSVAPQVTQADADAATKIRIVLVQDMQTNAAQMTGAQLFNDGTGPVTVINSFQNPNNFGRFRVLKDKMFTISNLSIGGTAGAFAQASWRTNFKFNVNFRTAIDCHFNATNGGTVADIVDSSFHILAGTDNAAYVPTLSYYSRVAYKDQ